MAQRQFRLRNLERRRGMGIKGNSLGGGRFMGNDPVSLRSLHWKDGVNITRYPQLRGKCVLLKYFILLLTLHIIRSNGQIGVVKMDQQTRG